MATVPVLSSRGLDHDSVFKSGELFPARDVCWSQGVRGPLEFLIPAI